ncbi:hypothetical protein LshimejAT787_0901770 [Lyophyllum shimeji]|uniref:Uncharacterized protein n=1 Tax=Lyophyllum shimeji TaxID=47721 RepID=A0A9P3UQ64_LYOSH|nr:hypothetical protein LshimejAT787_0901770 [Lyophyllum shimeji]
MRLTSLFVIAFAALSAVAAPLPYETGSLATDTSQVADIKPSPHDRSGSPLHARAPISVAGKAAGKLKNLQPLGVPTAQALKQQLRVQPGKVLLYAGPGGYIGQANEYIKKQEATPGAEHPTQMPAFWDNASKALAEMASGTVYVLVPKNTAGSNFHKGTILNRIEWPALLRNHKVTKVVKVNPDNGRQEVIKGAGH